MNTIKLFPKKIRALLKKGQVKPTYVILPLVTRLSVKEGKTRERGISSGPRIVYKWFAAKENFYWVTSG